MIFPIWPMAFNLGIVIKRWSEAESFSIFENQVYSHYKNLIFAIRTITPDEKRLILSRLRHFDLEVMVMPSLSNLLKYGERSTQFKKINVMDILNRNIHLNEGSISEKFKEKTVVITGAGGSIGGELCQQILLYNPSNIFLIENN